MIEKETCLCTENVVRRQICGSGRNRSLDACLFSFWVLQIEMNRIITYAAQLVGYGAPAAPPSEPRSRVATEAPVILSGPSSVGIAPLPLVLSDEVRRQIQSGPFGTAKIVALESTIISHGMPYPQNVKCAKEVESVVRKRGAVPATIAILDGVIHVGLGEKELELLGKLGPKCAKCSRRDLPLILAERRNGATTVSGTIWIASLVGIEVMATGGIGGVHRGGESTMDISADLVELGRTRTMVVCAGVKSILDIDRTLEVLETNGVSVMAFQSKIFPAFFTRNSGCAAPLTLKSVDDGARHLVATRQLNCQSGSVLGCPLPPENEADGNEIEKAIQQSLKEVEQKKIGGRDVTPYVLKRVNEITKGRSLTSNIALVKNNARIASDIAVAYFSLLQVLKK